MALVIPGVNGHISTNICQNALRFSDFENIDEQNILQFQNNKFNGVKVMQVLAMSGISD